MLKLLLISFFLQNSHGYGIKVKANVEIGDDSLASALKHVLEGYLKNNGQAEIDLNELLERIKTSARSRPPQINTETDENEAQYAEVKIYERNKQNDNSNKNTIRMSNVKLLKYESENDKDEDSGGVHKNKELNTAFENNKTETNDKNLSIQKYSQWDSDDDDGNDKSKSDWDDYHRINMNLESLNTTQNDTEDNGKYILENSESLKQAQRDNKTVENKVIDVDMSHNNIDGERMVRGETSSDEAMEESLHIYVVQQHASSLPTHGVRLQGKMDIGNDLASIFQNILRQYFKDSDSDNSEINFNKFISSIHDFVNSNPREKSYFQAHKKDAKDKDQIVNFNVNIDDPKLQYKKEKKSKNIDRHKFKNSKRNTKKDIGEENEDIQVNREATNEIKREKTVLEEIVGLHDSVHIYGKHKGNKRGLPLNNIKV